MVDDNYDEQQRTVDNDGNKWRTTNVTNDDDNGLWTVDDDYNK
jgi:hypothetical protein